MSRIPAVYAKFKQIKQRFVNCVIVTETFWIVHHCAIEPTGERLKLPTTCGTYVCNYVTLTEPVFTIVTQTRPRDRDTSPKQRIGAAR